ncbi:MAG TPA: ComEA family DNA-binding protein [Ktedonobacterales bacterium]|nr:ComEA family DNA-binding protein [Ktedonobacterales bacterium]
MQAWLARIMQARFFVVGAALLTVFLLAGVTINLLIVFGGWTPTFGQPTSQLIISGPGVSANATIQVDALGAVAAPGDYTLPEDARVHDLVTAAGGLLPDADMTRIDLAGRLVDGQLVYFPRVGEQVPISLGGKVNINLASADDLENELGLSATIALRIVAYRAAHGPFTAISQLLLVPISRTTYDRIKGLITV